MQTLSPLSSLEIIDSAQANSDYILVEVSAGAVKISCHIGHLDSVKSGAVDPDALVRAIELMIAEQLKKQMRWFDAKLCLWPQRFLAIDRSIEPVFLMIV